MILSNEETNFLYRKLNKKDTEVCEAFKKVNIFYEFLKIENKRYLFIYNDIAGGHFQRLNNKNLILTSAVQWLLYDPLGQKNASTFDTFECNKQGIGRFIMLGH